MSISASERGGPHAGKSGKANLAEGRNFSTRKEEESLITFSSDGKLKICSTSHGGQGKDTGWVQGGWRRTPGIAGCAGSGCRGFVAGKGRVKFKSRVVKGRKSGIAVRVFWQKGGVSIRGISVLV